MSVCRSGVDLYRASDATINRFILSWKSNSYSASTWDRK
jgi:hypothetical protein